LRSPARKSSEQPLGSNRYQPYSTIPAAGDKSAPCRKSALDKSQDKSVTENVSQKDDKERKHFTGENDVWLAIKSGFSDRRECVIRSQRAHDEKIRQIVLRLDDEKKGQHQEYQVLFSGGSLNS